MSPRSTPIAFDIEFARTVVNPSERQSRLLQALQLLLLLELPVPPSDAMVHNFLEQTNRLHAISPANRDEPP